MNLTPIFFIGFPLLMVLYAIVFWWNRIACVFGRHEWYRTPDTLPRVAANNVLAWRYRCIHCNSQAYFTHQHDD